VTSKEKIATALRNILFTFDAENYVFACIGTDRSTGDSLGPLVGSKLAANGYNVIGTLEEPLHAANLEERLGKVPAEKTVIAIDACLGKVESVGSVNVINGPLKPGEGVGKKLHSVGDYSIKGIVNASSGNKELNHLTVMSTRLSVVVKLAGLISSAIMDVIKPVNLKEIAVSKESNEAPKKEALHSESVWGEIAEKKYNVILADPPWQYRDKANAGKRGADHKYSTMSVDSIKALPVQDIAADDCALFLWVTNPFLPAAFEVIKAWGFEYKTVAFTWVKTIKSGPAVLRKYYNDNIRANGCFTHEFEGMYEDMIGSLAVMGMGNWTRQNTEICLLGVKGKPKRMNAGVHQVIFAPCREHSRKPDEQYERIERLLGGPEGAGPHLEMFARQTWSNWNSWGMEVGKFDRGE
jgi:putative sporulation protein YyaC